MREARPDAPAAEHAEHDAPGPEDAAGDDGRAGAAQARGGRGLRGRGHGDGQGLGRPRRQGGDDRPRCDRSRGSRAPAGHGPGRHQRGAARGAGAPELQARRADRRHGPGLARPARALAARLYAPPVQRLILELGKLPGIGQRTAQRLAFHLLRVDAEEANGLADAIREVKERIGLCEICFNLADEPRCRICQDARRDAELICVVEEPGDVIPIERTHEYRGRYHVLGGALSPIDGVDPEDLKIAELYTRVEAPDPAVREVVLATNPTTTGEATALHIAAAVRERAPRVAVTRLASGLPVGADLEYADEVTLGKALAGRRAL